MTIDLSFARAACVLPKEFKQANIFIIGAGGTGSFTAFNLARLACELNTNGKAVKLTIIDPDRVESANIPRSNFCAAEIDRFKAQALAERITVAWGLEVSYANEKLDYEKHIEPHFKRGSHEITILTGCVDNHLARREINRSLQESSRYHSSTSAPQVWWIDGGNGRSSGQVLIGSETKSDQPKNHFTATTICKKLPSPALLHPELLENQEVALRRENSERLISCAERIRLGEQSLNINQRTAIEIAQMLTEFLLTNRLRRFATYFDLESGTSRSFYCTPDQLEKALQEAKGNQQTPKKGKRKSGG